MGSSVRSVISHCLSLGPSQLPPAEGTSPCSKKLSFVSDSGVGLNSLGARSGTLPVPPQVSESALGEWSCITSTHVISSPSKLSLNPPSCFKRCYNFSDTFFPERESLLWRYKHRRRTNCCFDMFQRAYWCYVSSVLLKATVV